MSTKSYTNIKISDHLEDKYVAFLDVLGFKEMVYNKNHKDLDKYFNLIEIAFTNLNLKNLKIEKLSISDSLIFIAEDSEKGLEKLMEVVQAIQGHLALNNIFLRGGISFGPVCYYKSNAGNILVGKGYVDAYLLESVAKYPRVIIDPRILKRLRMDSNMFYTNFNMVKKNDEWIDEKEVALVHSYHEYEKRLTNDDAIFVAYANKIFIHAAKNDLHKKQMTYGGNILNNLKERLYSNQAHYEKYLWLKKYYWETLDELSSSAELLLDKKKHRYYNDLVTACGYL